MVSGAGARSAVVSPVFNETIGESKPFLFGKERHQITLYFFRRFFCAQPKAPRKTHDVRIYGDSFYDAIRIPQNNIGAFPCDTGKREHLFHSFGNLSAEFFFDSLCRGKDMLCLVAVEAGLPYILCKLKRTGVYILVQ